MQIHSLPRCAIDQRQSVTWLPDLFGICAFSHDRSQTIIGVRTVLR